ncbi:SusD family protein [Riemerella columbipharyngis]|uniref:SusD family protein n=2 Tax=Riemerella columbipharyngis TaxID=1071918 RepID=A0A1G6Y846_9FLAO|nr:SusD family protein [Riemerella columbipharyngis]
MMKKIILLLLSFTVVSCNRYLDVSPDSQLDINIDSEDKIAELLTAAYPKASYFPILETMSDNAEEVSGGVHTNLNEAMYYWRDFEQEDIDTPLNYWNDAYRGIAQANHALEYLKQYPQKTGRIKALYGEALLLRAYLHFMLVNIWAKPYSPNSDAPGIPYVTHPEKNAIPKYKRLTVGEVYDKIEEDMLLGIAALDEQYYKIPKYHFNKKAAYAFAARFYLYKGEWDKVIAYSDYILENDPLPKIRDWANKYQSYITTPYLIPRVYSSVDEPANLLITYTQSRWKRNLSDAKYAMSENLRSKLFSNFASKYSASFWYITKGNSLTGNRYVDKFTELQKFQDEGSNPRELYTPNVLFTTDEVLLNRAEAYAMKQKYDDAVNDIITFMKNKSQKTFIKDELLVAFQDGQENYTPFYPLTFYQGSLVNAIAELRRREFVHEGLRWFDIKRFYLTVNRNKAGDEYDINKILKKEDPRKLLQIPLQAQRLGLEANPR